MKNLILMAMVLSFNCILFAQNKETTVTIKSDESEVNWTGKKVTGDHTGTINIKEGQLLFTDNGELTGGEFVMDMSSIQCTDLDGGSKGKLEGHLASADFFGVEDHPLSNLKITTVEKDSDGNYNVTGDLTIKDITQTVSFTAIVAENKATANIVIDRTKYDIKYKSGSFFEDLGDKVIYDDFDIQVNLVF